MGTHAILPSIHMDIYLETGLTKLQFSIWISWTWPFSGPGKPYLYRDYRIYSAFLRCEGRGGQRYCIV